MSKLETTEQSLRWGQGGFYAAGKTIIIDDDQDITDDDDDDGLPTFEQFAGWQCPRLSENIENWSLGQIDRREAGAVVDVAGEHRS